MNVSLGGAGRGPDVGGANPLGGRPVQQVAHEGAVGEAGAGAAAGREDAGDDAAGARGGEEASREAGEGRTAAARGEVGARGGHAAGRRSPVRRRSSDASFAETGVSGLGLGLATGGGGTGSSLDVGDFCCPEYLGIMARRIKENWDLRQGVSGDHGDAVHDAPGRPDHRHRRRTVSGLRARPHRPALAATGQAVAPVAGGVYGSRRLTVYLKFEYQR